jgi:hypothetical protein
MALPRFSRCYLKRDRVELFIVAFGSTAQQCEDLLGVRHSSPNSCLATPFHEI